MLKISVYFYICFYIYTVYTNSNIIMILSQFNMLSKYI